MTLSYDTVLDAFLNKISDFDLFKIDDDTREEIIDGYLHRAATAFGKVCDYDLERTRNDADRQYDADISEEDAEELVEILSEGMVVQWMKPYVYKQELLENVMNTRDYTMYSPAELNMRVGNAYKQVRKDYTQMIREYSYNHGDLTELHL